MKICWAAEVEQNTNNCRLFNTIEKGVEIISKEVEKDGYTIGYDSKDYNANGRAVEFYKKFPKAETLIWTFVYIDVEE